MTQQTCMTDKFVRKQYPDTGILTLYVYEHINYADDTHFKVNNVMITYLYSFYAHYNYT